MDCGSSVLPKTEDFTVDHHRAQGDLAVTKRVFEKERIILSVVFCVRGSFIFGTGFGGFACDVTN